MRRNQQAVLDLARFVDNNFDILVTALNTTADYWDESDAPEAIRFSQADAYRDLRDQLDRLVNAITDFGD